jgi:hypothetical protein
MLPTTECIHRAKFLYVTDTILTKMFIQALENEIEKKHISISSFFRYLDSNLRCNYKLKDTIMVLKKYFRQNNRNYPDSLSIAGLDITNLYSIVRNCNLDEISKADFDRFDDIREIRNICIHSDKMTKEDCENVYKKMVSVIDDWSYIEDDMKIYYKQRMDIILKNDNIHQIRFIRTLNYKFNLISHYL